MKPLIKTAIAAAIAAASTASIAATDCNARHDEHNISYNYVSSNPGDVINVNGKEYTIVRMPFVEFGSDKRFYVQFPQWINPVNFNFSLSTSHVTTEPTGCINLEMAGERVNVKLPTTAEDSRYISTTIRPKYGTTVRSTLSSYATVSIRVGETKLYVSLRSSVTEEDVKTKTGAFDSTPFDFTDNFDESKQRDASNTQAIDDLLDYIIIGTF
jgi:hypothetical protein